jgi:protein-tyrosine phosphatase
VPEKASTEPSPSAVPDKPSSVGHEAAGAEGRPGCPVVIVAPHNVFNILSNSSVVPVFIDASVDLIGGYDPGAYGVEMGAFYLLQGAAVLRCLPGGDDPLTSAAALVEAMDRALDAREVSHYMRPGRIALRQLVIAVSSEPRARQLREVLVSEELQAALKNAEKDLFIIYKISITVHAELWRKYRWDRRLFLPQPHMSKEMDFSDLPARTAWMFGAKRIVSEIVPDLLYVEGSKGYWEVEELRALGITHVVEATSFRDSKSAAADIGAQYMCVNVLDDPSLDISAHFDRVYDLVFGPAHTAATSPRRVLVHCAEGISRSPTLVVACLMKAYFDGRSEVTRLLGASPPVVCVLKECLGLVFSQRKRVDPNEGFLRQLMALEAQLISTRAGASGLYRPSFASVEEVGNFRSQVYNWSCRGLDWRGGTGESHHHRDNPGDAALLPSKSP